MTTRLKSSLIKGIYRLVKRKISLLMIACMLGISNVILEEDRMIHDTRAKIEHQEIQPEDD
jgi:hypothetical protein